MKQFPIGQNHGSSPASATMREYIFHNLAKRKYYIRDMISLPAVLKWTAGEELVDRRRDVTVRRLIGKVNICLLICCFITFLWLKLTKQETHSSTTLSTDNESIYHLERSSRHEELSKPPLPSSVVVPLSSSSSSTSFTDYQNVENISNSLFESSKSIYLASAGGKIKLREGAPKYSSTRSNTSFPSSTSSSSLNSVQRFQRRNEIQVQASGSSSFTGIAFLLDITCTPSTTIYKTVPSQDMLNSICDDVERAAARAAERLARVLFVRSTVRISVDYEPFCDLQGLGTTSLTTSNRNTASSAKKRNALKKRSLLRAKTNKIGKFRLLRRRSAVKDRKEIPIERDIYPAIGTSDSSSSTFSSFSSACGSTDQTLARAGKKCVDLRISTY